MAAPRSAIAEHFFGTVTVGERGQVVIPAEARKQFAIESGDKLLVFSHPHTHCFTLVKIEDARDFMEQLSSIIVRQHAETAEEDAHQ